MRYYILLAVGCFLLLSSCTKYEDTNKFTLNYFIDVIETDTSNNQIGSISFYDPGSHIYNDTFTTTSALSTSINLTRYNFYSTSFLLELYTPRSYYYFNGKTKVMKFSSDTSGINKNDTLDPNIQNAFAIAFKSFEWSAWRESSSIKYFNVDSSYNNVLKIEKDNSNENTYVITGEFKLVNRRVDDSSLYYLISGKYRLPFYTK